MFAMTGWATRIDLIIKMLHPRMLQKFLPRDGMGERDRDNSLALIFNKANPLEKP
jgi:hypothetical protein